MDQWALLSVSDKTGIVELAQGFVDQGIGLLASGGTYQYLRDHGLTVKSLEDLTGFTEILGGRVKTLHPRIYAGILSRETPDDVTDRQKVDAPHVVAVVVNLYPFEAFLNQGADQATLIEKIDIGGVALIRAAAKNFQHVAVVVDPSQYATVLAKPLHAVTVEERRRWAYQAFNHVAYYDALIAQSFGDWEGHQAELPELYVVAGRKSGMLRYGENPHQRAGFYAQTRDVGFQSAKLHQGKALSYNNLADADTAWRLAATLTAPAAVAVKHQTPCGAGVGQSLAEAYEKAYQADPVSIFGGIVALNGIVDAPLANRLTEIFLEVIIAEGFTDEALKVLSAKKNVRVLEMPFVLPEQSEEIRTVTGGFLVQERDRITVPWQSLKQVAGPAVSLAEYEQDITLAWATVGFVKSNAIVVVNEGMTVGIGGGQTNRIDAARQALAQAGDKAHGAVLASDAFFPFGDVMEEAAKHRIGLVIQPGGSVRDNESIDAANAHGIPLFFTGERHFRH
ncbi:bifunctional phosphoribosylaminoimidazolecarboxamide formyltransferase/IMP cyclohydrolase [Sulfobacillus sp. hq2]|uniref:bifunctional phosphoribosylaminoimidazolecarboxamide formyltransferase/IMP cyclohydrolase n=1 Tax=Sulfobacillus TaxID=28033 RepID=UPI000CD0289E|nr:bifunctional phosphoribosylaminoimidazolecarboxamide formyltransferase/IMP cyclohydrolase [Sulfobacillus sp. hq2]POB11878.1 bifunctional phosphoribosylaminoimidazolecarboxamide formyltransferase/inosine monophosphate cyclohydrolase [Sulfobacillus sp. hq2]